MDKSCLEFEQEIYVELKFTRDEINPLMYTFEAKEAMVLFYFANKSEAETFKNLVDKRLKDINNPVFIIEKVPEPQPKSILKSKFSAMRILEWVQTFLPLLTIEISLIFPPRKMLVSRSEILVHLF